MKKYMTRIPIAFKIKKKSKKFDNEQSPKARQFKRQKKKKKKNHSINTFPSLRIKN